MKEKELILSACIDELHRMHEELCRAYDNVNSKILLFLTGALGLLSYLYRGNTIQEKLFMPKEVYGIIFYFIGLGLCLTAIALLIIGIKPVKWIIPTESKVHDKPPFKSHRDALEYIKSQYIEAWRSNLCQYEMKGHLLNRAVAFLIPGGIVLLILKTFRL